MGGTVWKGSDLVYPLQENVHLVCPFCTWAGIDILAISCTRVTPQATMVGGRQLALATITRYVLE